MEATDVAKIKKQLKKSLDHKRYEHTLGVAYTAAALAMRYNDSGREQENGKFPKEEFSMESISMKNSLMDRAFLAGLLHDCAKCMDNNKKLTFCKKHGIDVTSCELKNPFLLHAKVGQYLAKNEFHVKDEDVLNAIRYHTTGRPGMSLLEKIVFIADYIEPGRIHAPNLEAIRYMAFQDLNRALLTILSDTLEYLKGNESEIDPQTRITYEYYKELEEV